MQTSNLQAPRIHLIENEHLYYPIAPHSTTYESGYWLHLSDILVEQLIGGRIYFHQTRAERSYMSGTITGFRHSGDNEQRTGSIIFQFQRPEQDERVFAGENGWEPEFRSYRKIVL